jgi:hypothetical protein
LEYELEPLEFAGKFDDKLVFTCKIAMTDPIVTIINPITVSARIWNRFKINERCDAKRIVMKMWPVNIPKNVLRLKMLSARDSFWLFRALILRYESIK